MKKIKSLVLGLLAFSCLTASACDVLGTTKDSTYTVTLMDGSKVLSTVEKDKATHLDAPAAPTKEGYTFKGWFVDEACTIPYTPDLLSANLTLYAKFEANTLYITLNLNGGTLEEDVTRLEVKTGEAYTLPTPTKEGYVFLGWTVDGEDFPASGTYDKNNSIRVSANWVLESTLENAHFITVNFNGGTVDGEGVQTMEVEEGAAYTLPTPVRNGYRFDGYTVTIDGVTEDFALSGTFNYTQNITVKAVWTQLEEDPDEAGEELFLNKGSYFKEREATEEEFTYVFVTGGEYTFSTFEALEIKDAASGALTQNGKAFTANAVEDSFTLVITKKINDALVTYERKAKIVDQVTTFAPGDDYSSIWGAGAANRENSFIEVKADAIMSVGASNYVPDLAVGTLNSTALNEETAYLSVTATADGAETQDFTYENGVINFGSSLVGKKVALTFKAKYDLDATAVTMEVNVNNGVNVYNNAELKAAYGNRSVSEINVLRNIKAEIGVNDYVEGTQYPINEYEYGVYTRLVSSTNDQVTVNGNFFKIDGSDLPLGNNDVDDREWSVAGDAGYYVCNMQVGLFLYYNRVNNQSCHNGQATFNDLYLTGNFEGAADKTEDYKGKYLLVNSGTYHGIVLRGGRVSVNNTSIVNTNIALFTGGGISSTDGTQQATQWTVNSAYLDHSWSNQMYMYDFTKASFTNSYLGDCGGASIHLDDIAYDASETSLNTELYIDATTKIDTWIGGSETYFTSRGFGPLALQLKGGVNQGLADATAGYKPMYAQAGVTLPDTKITKTINSVECMNLVLLVRGVGSENSDWAADQNGIPSIKTDLPIYADLMKAAVQDATAFDLTNAPGLGKPVYMGFNTKLVDPGVAAADYMFGFVEVMNA